MARNSSAPIACTSETGVETTNSKNELIRITLADTTADLSYSIEEMDRDEKKYIVLGISTVFEHHTNILQWLYFDAFEKIVYEYDLPADSLVKFY